MILVIQLGIAGSYILIPVFTVTCWVTGRPCLIRCHLNTGWSIWNEHRTQAEVGEKRCVAAAYKTSCFKQPMGDLESCHPPYWSLWLGEALSSFLSSTLLSLTCKCNMPAICLVTWNSFNNKTCNNFSWLHLSSDQFKPGTIWVTFYTLFPILTKSSGWADGMLVLKPYSYLDLKLEPSSSAGKESTRNGGDPSSIPELGRSAGEGIDYPLQYSWTSLVTQLVKNLPAMWKTWVGSLGWEDPLKKGMATHSSILAWRIPWTA